jgi:hypothetical protein
MQLSQRANGLMDVIRTASSPARSWGARAALESDPLRVLRGFNAALLLHRQYRDDATSSTMATG